MPVFIRYEQDWQKVELRQLEERKRKLDYLRQFKKRPSDLGTHEQSYISIREAKLQAIE